MKKCCAFLAFLILVFCMHSSAFSADSDSLVILLYMTGSSLESGGGSASADLEEIMTYLPRDRGIRLIAMISGARQWRMDIPADETSVYEITDGNLLKIRQLDSRSMGSPDTLSDFLCYSAERYPAEQYGLILWDHGAGPLVGICFDENYPTDQGSDHLTMDELSRALSSSPFAEKRLSFIGFDACLMASLEVAAVAAPYAEYMIASQELIPQTGWNYAFLRDLTGYESGSEIGEKVIRTYEDSLKDNDQNAAMSCLDLRRAEPVMEALDRLFADIERSVTPVSYPDYTRIRAESKTFGSFTTSDYDLIDLVDLLNMFQEENLADCSESIALIQDMVSCRFASAHGEYVHGVSIYYPFDNKKLYETSEASLYHNMSFIPGYQSYIRRISDIYMGEQLLNWQSDYNLKIMNDAGVSVVSMELTPEEMRNTVRSRLIVAEEILPGTYQHIFYADGDRIHMTDTDITAFYRGEALYLVSPEGEILAGPVSWYPVEDGICVFGIAEYAVDWDHFDWTQPMENRKFQDAVRLVYHMNDKGELSFSNLVILSDAQDGMNLPSSTGPDSFSELILLNSGVSDVASLDHFLLDDSLSFRVPLSGEAPRFAFLPVFGNNNRVACIRITDTQGNTVCSETVRIDNPSCIPLAGNQVCAEQDNIRVSLQSADLITGFHAGIKCVFSIRNGSDSVRQVSVRDVFLENMPVQKPAWYRSVLSPGEETDYPIFIDGSAIGESGIKEVNTVTAALCLQDENGAADMIDAVASLQVNTAVFSAGD